MAKIENREQAIIDCFTSWIRKDAEKFKNVFSQTGVTYIESWGPAYKNLTDILRWFDEWNKENSVISWEMKKIWHSDSTCICEWHFVCVCNGVEEGFDGISVVEFDDSNKITYIKEYQSKTPNYYPYE